MRTTLPWELLSKGRRRVTEVEYERKLGASWHRSGTHESFSDYKRQGIVCGSVTTELAWDDRRVADRDVNVPRSQVRQQEVGGYCNNDHSVAVGKEKAKDVKSYGALKNILDILDSYPKLSGSAPLSKSCRYALQIGERSSREE